jgi:hypothetical protein
VADETKRGTLAEPPARCLRCGEARPTVEFRSRASLASEVRYNHSCSRCLRTGAMKGRAGRQCAADGCPTTLSRYNDTSFCGVHGGWRPIPV